VVVSLVREVGIWAIGSPRFAPAIMAGLVLIGALGLTLVAARPSRPTSASSLCPPSSALAGSRGTRTRTTCPRRSRIRFSAGMSATRSPATGSATTWGSSPTATSR
jgi:hypothetical protein